MRTQKRASTMNTTSAACPATGTICAFQQAAPPSVATPAAVVQAGGAPAPAAQAAGPGLAMLLTVFAFCLCLYQNRQRLLMLYNRLRAIAIGGRPAAPAANTGAAEGVVVRTDRVLHKLQALQAKLFGVSSCGWTTKQLDVFGHAKQKAEQLLYVECSDPTKNGACGKVTHFPTWEIDGKLMPPGMVALEVLEVQCDALLIESKARLVEKEKAEEKAAKAEEPHSKPSDDASQAASDDELHTPSTMSPSSTAEAAPAAPAAPPSAAEEKAAPASPPSPQQREIMITDTQPLPPSPPAEGEGDEDSPPVAQTEDAKMTAFPRDNNTDTEAQEAKKPKRRRSRRG